MKGAGGDKPEEGFTWGENCPMQKAEVVSWMYALQTCLFLSYEVFSVFYITCNGW